MSEAISSHGTLIDRAPSATPSTWTEIGELLDITAPELSRNSTDVSPHTSSIDAYVMHNIKRGELRFRINFVASGTTGATHNHLTGLYKSLIDKAKDGWRLRWPDGDVWIMSGAVSNIGRAAPVEGALQADVSVRPTGRMYINGVAIG
jgi:hypothetical protein